MYSNLIPCRNGGHLQNCIYFECNVMFKCTASYCIPWSYVCDGKWDCPDGDDELNNPFCNKDRACVHMYKCRNTTQTCVHVGNVCDSTKECPLGDDELYCDLKNVKCPLRCNCLLFAIDCRNASFLDMQTEIIQPFYLSIFISTSDIFSLADLDDILGNAIVVKLTMNCITEISQLCKLQKILLFDLGFNYLRLIMKNVFASLYLLQTLCLNDNHITLLETGAFNNLSNLKYINNPLMNLQEGVLKYSLQLKLFYIVNVSLVDVHAKALHDLPINVIITTEYSLCCISSNETLCPTYKPWYISCSDILPKGSIKVYFLSVFSLVLLLNVTSILFYFQTRKSNKTFSILCHSVNT